MQYVTDFSRPYPSFFQWLNEPADYRVEHGLHIKPDPQTDFWQRTHYGFQNDNGHALLAPLQGDFCLRTQARFQPKHRYDQCGLLVRLDAENWIKVSTEFETAELSMLGSVVTNLGYSDWATTELDSDPGQMWYQISKNGPDFLLQASLDGQVWRQLRICHLQAAPEPLLAGPYACSPTDGGFTCTFTYLSVGDNRWGKTVT